VVLVAVACGFERCRCLSCWVQMRVMAGRCTCVWCWVLMCVIDARLVQMCVMVGAGACEMVDVGGCGGWWLQICMVAWVECV
jgi:hypothetical protein